MKRVTHRVTYLAATTALIASLAVGCGGEQMAETLGEQAINGDIELEDDSITITDDEGNEFAAGSGAAIPETWPSDVPLFPSGELVLATSQSDGTAAALWESGEQVEVVADEYDALLMSQGFTLEQDSTIAGAIVRTYSNAEHTVNVAIAPADGSTDQPTAVNITVVPK